MPSEEHSLSMINRGRAKITGVNDVKSFDETEIVLDTGQGVLTIVGSGLHVKSLCLEKGETDLEGRIDKLLYSDKGSLDQDYKSLLSRIFR